MHLKRKPASSEKLIALPLNDEQLEWLRNRARLNGRSLMREAQQVLELTRRAETAQGGAQ